MALKQTVRKLYRLQVYNKCSYHFALVRACLVLIHISIYLAMFISYFYVFSHVHELFLYVQPCS